VDANYRHRESQQEALALLNTDILSEISKGIDPNVVANPAAYRQFHGFLTLSAIGA
jgi:hypothetical protein